MKPIRTVSSNMVYLGEPPEVADLHCQRIERGHIRSVWRPTPEERAAFAGGANVSLDILAEPIPPVHLSVIDEEGVLEDAPEIAARFDEWRTKEAASA